MKTDGKSAWDGYRTRERLANAGYVVMVITGLLGLGGVPFVGALQITFFSGVALTIPHGLWRCPACKKSFFSTWRHFGNVNPWRKSCVHCALQKWQEPPLSSDELLEKRLLAVSSTPPMLIERKGGGAGKGKK